MVLQRPATADKNGNMPVYFEIFNKGTLPERARVISGTVAERAGLEVGKVYLLKVEKTGHDEKYGDQFRHSVAGEVDAVKLAISIREFPAGYVVDNIPATTPETVAEGVEEGKF